MKTIWFYADRIANGAWVYELYARSEMELKDNFLHDEDKMELQGATYGPIYISYPEAASRILNQAFKSEDFENQFVKEIVG